MRRRFATPLVTVLLGVVLLAGVSSSPRETLIGEAEAQATAPFRANVVAKNLSVPWDLAHLPNGDALVTERDTGRLLRVKSSGKVKLVQRFPVDNAGEGGLLGVALAPKFRENRVVFAYYTTNRDNRVVRFRLGKKGRPIVAGIPSASSHNGGRIAFGPDNKLYVGTGDARMEQAAQNENSMAGKILRVRADGRPAPGNPFGNRVYSLGHRNVQGLSWDRQGRLYASELGQQEYDEVNRIRAGENYGWPVVEGRGGEPEYTDPVSVFRPENASPSGAAVQTRTGPGAIRAWDGDLFTANLRGERLWRLQLGANGRVTDREPLVNGRFGRLRHVTQAPDGSLWLLTSNRDGRGDPVASDDRIIRLSRR